MWWVPTAVVVVAAAFGLAHAAVVGWIPTIPAAQDLGEVGAAYGVAAVLISGFALVASMVQQRRQLHSQQKNLAAQQQRLKGQLDELVRQTEALIETSRAQSRAATSLEGQLVHMSERGRLDDYDRRLERFAELQVEIEDEALDVDVASDISQEEAQRRLGRLYLATLTILLGELERLRHDPVLALRAQGLEQELRTGLGWKERVLLYLAVVPPHPRLPSGYKPSELGRLMMVLGLLPYIEPQDTTERAATFRRHFLPLWRRGS
jgi:cell division protein FtsL